MPEKPKKYKIVISKDALLDMKSTIIFFVVEDSTITVIRVLKDRMYWQSIIKKMQKINR